VNTFSPVAAAVIGEESREPAQFQILEGDALQELDSVENGSCKLIVTSPPYNIGKEYERDQRMSLREYARWLDKVISKLCDKVSTDGHVCWQSGNYVEDGEVFPLDTIFYRMFKRRGFKLRNRIIWHFNFGLHAQTRFSGRYETLLWFTKSDNYTFNLDPVRVPQLYPGKRHSSKKGKKAGQPSGNPKGKNPSDFWSFDANVIFKGNPIWDFPNVKSNHPEKTIHPCQFPSELVERCVLALTDEGDLVLDPFIGSGTTAIAALKYDRRVIGIDRDSRYVQLARQRIADRTNLTTRPMGLAVRSPQPGEAVASIPKEWASPDTGEGSTIGEDNKEEKEEARYQPGAEARTSAQGFS
jgi:adenine-specific DNA-methyltransferase